MSILPHPRRPDNPNWAMLADFASGGAELREDHRHWLQRRVLHPAHGREAVWVYLRGFASRLGGADTNLLLSQRRADAVRRFVLADIGMRAERITGMAWAGESRSGDDPTDDSARWRSVEVIVTRTPLTDEIRPVPVPPIPITRVLSASLASTPETHGMVALEPGEQTFTRVTRLMEASARSARSRTRLERGSVPSDQRITVITLETEDWHSEVVRGTSRRLRFTWARDPGDSVTFVHSGVRTTITRDRARAIYNDPSSFLARLEHNPYAATGVERGVTEAADLVNLINLCLGL